MFANAALLVWDAKTIFAYTDLAMVVVAPFADWYWSLCYKYAGRLDSAQLAIYCCFTLCMTFRIWLYTTKSCNDDSLSGKDRNLHKFEFVWSCRSAALVSTLYPEFGTLWDELVRVYGYDYACAVCKVSIYVTDPDHDSCQALYQELKETSLFHHGSIRFGRPDLASIIGDHSVDLVCTRRSSSTLLIHVGGAALAREIHQSKLVNDLKLAQTGNKKHTIEFVTDNYGGAS